MTKLPTVSDSESASGQQSPFEQIKRTDPDGNEFWSARDLMPILEYTKWQNFKTVLIRAQIACENSGYDPITILPEPVKWSPLARMLSAR